MGRPIKTAGFCWPTTLNHLLIRRRRAHQGVGASVGRRRAGRGRLKWGILPTLPQTPRGDRPEHLDDGAAYRRIGRRRAASRRRKFCAFTAPHRLPPSRPGRGIVCYVSASRGRLEASTVAVRSLGGVRQRPRGDRFASGFPAPDPRQPVRTRRQRLPTGYDTGALPCLHVVGDAGEQPAQFDSGR
jgi:hypothetical protein